MKTALLLALSLVALAQDHQGESADGKTVSSDAYPATAGTDASVSVHPEPTETGKPEEGHISVTSYDSPWSSGESTWTVPTIVSYKTGSNYTSMLTAKSTAAASTLATSTEHHSGASSSSSSAAATGSQTAEGFPGGANELVAGAGVVFLAVLAHLL